MRFVCLQKIIMKYDIIPNFFPTLRKMSQNVSSAAVVIGASRVNQKIRLKLEDLTALKLSPDLLIMLK